ncbi:hypothetical protein G6F31_015467 [Rhizopus arrhizus]|nr:hypothetical protein G6F31_015467 [Rhizopus arrhizus]
MPAARCDRSGGNLGTERRVDRRGGFAEGRAGAVALLADGRHELRVLRGQARQVFGTAHHAFQRGIVEFVDRGGADALAEGNGDRQLGVVDDATGGHIVQRETDVAADRAGQHGSALIGLGQGDDLVEDGLGLGFGEDTHGVRAPDRSAEAACGVDDVDAVEARGRRTVRDRRDLARLALAVEERTAQAVVALVGHGGAGIPEFRRADLVGHVFQHAGDLAVLDLVEQLAAELRVVALLVDRIRTAAVDPDAVLHVLAHVLDAARLLARRQRDIGHALELHAGPGIGIAAAVRCVAAEDRWVFTPSSS